MSRDRHVGIASIARRIPYGAGALALLFLVLCGSSASAQTTARRLTTIDAIRQFPGYFHLQNVLLRGELMESGSRIVLHADDRELRILIAAGVQSRSGPVEVRGQLIDVGRLEPGDPRVTGFAEGRDSERWPRPGEELVLNATAVGEAQTATTATIRALALEPWKFEGQTVTVVGTFRGRNLFGDAPDAPGTSRYDFIVRGTEGAVWVTGMRPRGRGFDLEVDRRQDTGRWLQVTGTVVRDRGLVSIGATQLALGKEPEGTAPVDDAAAAAVPLQPAEVVFSSPAEGETEVGVQTSIRLQFSKGLRDMSLPGRIVVGYVGGTASSSPAAPLEFRTRYDAANRAVEIRFTRPLEPFRTVKLDVLEGLEAFDGAPVRPWTLTFSLAGL